MLMLCVLESHSNRSDNCCAATTLLLIEATLSCVCVVGPGPTSLSHEKLQVYFIRRKPRRNARAMITSMTQVRSPASFATQACLVLRRAWGLPM